MKRLNILAIAFSVLLLSSCSGFIRIQHTEGLKEVKQDMKKVVCISPDIVYFKDYGFKQLDYGHSIEIEQFFLKKLKKYSKAAGFEYEIINPSNKDQADVGLYNMLIPLKNEILQASVVRDNPLNNSYRAYNAIQKTVFADALVTAPEYAGLVEKYGTPYFAWYGVFSTKGKTVCIHSIVDVRKSEIVYHEVKQIGNKANERNLRPLIYDSFKMMKQ